MIRSRMSRSTSLLVLITVVTLSACSSSTAVNGSGGSFGPGGSAGGHGGAAGTPGLGGKTSTGGTTVTGGTTSTGGVGIGGATAGTTGTAGTSGRVPVKHRPAAVACSMDRPASACVWASMPDAGVILTCTRDADCTDGTNGRCDPLTRTNGCSCSYDQCFTDTDCTTGGPCECRPVTVAGQGVAAPTATPINLCKAGNCRVDKDCGGGAGYCSPSLGECGRYAGVVGYYCHTPQDKCTDDADCAAQGGGDCRLNSVSGAWECQTGQCAG